MDARQIIELSEGDFPEGPPPSLSQGALPRLDAASPTSNHPILDHTQPDIEEDLGYPESHFMRLYSLVHDYDQCLLKMTHSYNHAMLALATLRLDTTLSSRSHRCMPATLLVDASLNLVSQYQGFAMNKQVKKK